MKAPETHNTSRFAKLVKEAKKAKYFNEIALLNGLHESDNTHCSILLYTTFKCASVYVTGILRKLAKEAEIIPINLNGYAWETGESKEQLQIKTAFCPKSF